METKLTRIALTAKEKSNIRFTSLAHLINAEHLKECHQRLNPRKVPGVDEVTKEEYGMNLEANLQDLITRMKRNAYRPQPVKRKYIPKINSKEKRPLGIPSYEDKLVQAALANILNAIYEADFLNCSYGFRPGRDCHEALKELNYIIERKEINYIVDVDIRGFFDHVNHEWLKKFVAHRIADSQIQRLIVRILKAGVIIEAGIKYETPEGTPQGGVVSPILANIYLHYVLDLWFEKRIKRDCQGDAYMIRYADDFVCCFQHEKEARTFLRELEERLRKFNLEVAEEKTRIINFGRFAKSTDRNGKNKPETFELLGFTHYCSTSRVGKFRVKRRTSKKKMWASLLRCKEWLRQNRNKPVKELMKIFRMKIQGHHNYYGITDNIQALRRFNYQVRRMLFKWLNRRSQRKSFGWDKYELFLAKFPLPEPKIRINIYQRRLN
jgi:RNA-directed DNA polymerase